MVDPSDTTPRRDTAPRSDDDRRTEYASLREEMLRANDQALSLQGFTLASVALVVGAGLGIDLSAGTRLVLFSALQVVVALITVQVGARRRQHANIASYMMTFHEHRGEGWEQRLERRRAVEGALPVDRWYSWGESLFTVLIATIGAVGSAWSLSQGVVAAPGWLWLAYVVNVAGIVGTLWQGLTKRRIADLMASEVTKWQRVRSEEQG